MERLVHDHEIPFAVRGDRIVFQRGEIDAWASQQLLGMPRKELDRYHQRTMKSTQAALQQVALIPALLRPRYIDLALAAKTKSSVIRNMVALAESTGRLFDPAEMIASVSEREALCPTGLPGGFALLHARHQMEYRFDGSFLVLGRTIQSIPFGAPDGYGSRLFFLVCCEDDRIHLHTLARLCLLAQKTDVIRRLMEVGDATEAYDALESAEQEVLPDATAGGG